MREPGFERTLFGENQAKTGVVSETHGPLRPRCVDADGAAVDLPKQDGPYAPALAAAAFSACWLRLAFTILLRWWRSLRNDLAS